MIYQHTNARGNASVALDPTTLKPLGPDLTDNNYAPNLFESTLYYYTADVNWDLHWAKLVSATSYSEQTTDIEQDGTRTYGPILALIGPPNGVTPSTSTSATRSSPRSCG